MSLKETKIVKKVPQLLLNIFLPRALNKCIFNKLIAETSRRTPSANPVLLIFEFEEVHSNELKPHLKAKENGTMMKQAVIFGQKDV